MRGRGHVSSRNVGPIHGAPLGAARAQAVQVLHTLARSQSPGTRAPRCSACKWSGCIAWSLARHAQLPDPAVRASGTGHAGAPAACAAAPPHANSIEALQLQQVSRWCTHHAMHLALSPPHQGSPSSPRPGSAQPASSGGGHLQAAHAPAAHAVPGRACGGDALGGARVGARAQLQGRGAHSGSSLGRQLQHAAIQLLDEPGVSHSRQQLRDQNLMWQAPHRC